MGTKKVRICKPGGEGGTVFQKPNPLGDTSDRAKVLIYGFFLLYSFIGVSIVADRFMAAIERITSRKRRVKVPGTTGKFVTINVWNETVANLTLMALGSSAPEILLAINEIFKNKFHSGQLGPSTIVGSAAFNLFVIIAVCINAVPSGETRQIKETAVFFITAFFSVFAYFWLLFIVQFNSKDIVDVVEGAITFMMMPVLVWVSYAADAGYFAYFTRSKADADDHAKGKAPGNALTDGVNKEALAYERLMRQQGGRGGRIPTDDPDEAMQQTQSNPVDTVFTVVQKACGLVGRGFGYVCRKITKCCVCLIPARCRRRKKKATDMETEDDEVEEEEPDLSDPNVDILDEDGERIENETGILTFKCDSMEVIGDLEDQQHLVPVYRKNGLEGRISCKYRMEKFSATPGYDYVDDEGTVDFKTGVDKAEIEITILPKEIGEKSDQFQIILEEATNDAIFNPNSDGGEECCLLTVTILNANPATSRMARLFGFIDSVINLDEMRQGSSAWADQIKEAWYVNGSQEEQEEAKFLDWVAFVIFWPWKMIYAIATPPPPFLGGWVCFVVALLHIGALTALIGDMAELFGCAAGIPDNITAISVVALGTSLPDLFASKAAATQDEWADASIVNVTGSNSVNVFLGIGLPWMMASLYWHFADGTQDEYWMSKYADDFLDRCPKGCFVVESGDLAFSVVVFSVGAVVCLTVIRIRRVIYDGELGGPAGSDSKACSSFLLIMLWVFYIALSCWKSFSGVDDWVTQVLAIAGCAPIVIALMVFFGAMLQLLRISKDYIGEEGFFGIAVAVAIVVLRAVYFFMFQLE